MSVFSRTNNKKTNELNYFNVLDHNEYKSSDDVAENVNQNIIGTVNAILNIDQNLYQYFSKIFNLLGLFPKTKNPPKKLTVFVKNIFESKRFYCLSLLFSLPSTLVSIRLT